MILLLLKLIGMSLLITAVVISAMWCGYIIGKEIYKGIINE